ncbi:MAG TPA: PAS domain S-box protein [Vicinamibacteria bacterium]|nr:PAS domain S-box protein [Vicinamibacteria bacterium]
MKPSDEAARLAELRRYAVLDTPPEPAFDELTGLASRVCSTPMALLSLVDQDRQWFKAAHGFVGVRETPRDASFCSHAIQDRKPLVVADALADERFRENPFVLGAPHVRFYAGAPLVTPAGYALGTLCVADSTPRSLLPHELDGLEALSRQAMALLELRRRSLDLARTEERFKLLVELGADALAVIDASGHVRYASPSTRRVLGRTPRQLLGRGVFERMHPDDVAPARALLAQCVERPGRPLRAEFRLQNDDGSWRWIESEVVNRLEAPGVFGLVASYRDVSARRELEQALRDREERFRALAETARDAIVSADDEGSMTYLNTAAERMFGFAPGEAHGRPLTELMPERFQEAHRRGLARFLATGEARAIGRSLELIGRRRGGREFPIELSLASGHAAGRRFFTAIIRDLEERRRIEEAQLAVDGEPRVDLTHALVHDLRAPLTAILGSLEYLEAARDETGRRPLLRTVRSNAERLLKLVTSLLQIGRLEASEMPIERRMVRLEEVLRDAADAQAPLARAAGVRIDLELDALPEIHADPALVERVVQNLLDNAIKFTPAGGSVHVVAHDRGDRVEVEVADTGEGVPAEVETQLFKKFARGPQKQRGSGLGLAFCRLAVEAHGGAIACRNEAGRGAVFSFTLPRS